MEGADLRRRFRPPEYRKGIDPQNIKGGQMEEDRVKERSRKPASFGMTSI